MNSVNAADESQVAYESVDGIGVVGFDDGKVNALSYSAIKDLDDSLRAAIESDRAVVLAGRPGSFCGGFDLAEVRRGPAEAAAIIKAGGRLIRRIFESPKPVVVACTGHAVAGGAVILLVADLRIGAEGSSRIGLNEVSIGLGLPEFVIRVGQYRLDRTRCERLLLGEMCDPAAAACAGYLDRVVREEELLETALESARELAARDPRAYAVTKASARAGLADASWGPQ